MDNAAVLQEKQILQDFCIFMGNKLLRSFWGQA